MRRVFAILFACQLSLGCFVFEELDASKDLLDNPTFEKTEKKKAPQPGPAKSAGGGKKGPSAQERLAGWWKEARSLNTGEVDESMVSCELGGSTQFMSRSDCLARGSEAGAVR